MKITELSRDELLEVKQRYYTEHENQSPSYGELADIDTLVSDDAVYDEYGDIDFVKDDFFCNQR